MYEESQLGKHGQFRILDTIFIWGIILAPMTELRIYKFGPGEVLLIIWMIATFLGFNPSTKYGATIPVNEIVRYQRANLVMMLVGCFVNITIYFGSFSFGIAVTDYLSHLFMVLLSGCMILYFEERDIEDIHWIIKRIVFWGAVIYSAILIYALYYGERLFGIVLWIGNKTRFMALGGNPHQIGMITGSGLFLSLYLLSIEEKKWKKIFYVVIAGIWYWISDSLKSDTLTIAYVIIIALFFAIKILKITDNRGIRAFIFLLGFGIFLFYIPRLINTLVDFVENAGNGLGRLEIWNNGLGQLFNKPLCWVTGLGPGGNTGMYMRASGNEMEAHNTYVQQILNSGILICGYYILMIIRLIRRPLEKNTYLVLSVLYFVLYGFGGNMNRRVLVWFTYSIAWVLFQKTEGTGIDKL